MANKERGEVTLDLGDRVITLRPSLNALCRAEEITGKSTSELMVQASIGNMSATRVVLWSYLQKYHGAEFDTFEKVGDMIDDIGLDAVNAQLQKLMDLNQPPGDAKAPAGAAERPPAAQAGSGDRSSLRLAEPA